MLLFGRMKGGVIVRVSLAILFALIVTARGGELRKSYFEATKPGAWSEYLLSSGEDSKSTFVYQRQPDDNGHIVIELTVKILAGPGKDSKSKNTYFMPPNFNLARDGLSFGKFIERMSMSSGGLEMAVDKETLNQIRRSEKDFRGAVTYEATEKIDGRTCDRYAYSLRPRGQVPTKETGTLWLSDSVPFGIVRQVAEVFKQDGTKISGFEMQLQDSGVNQLLAETQPKPNPPERAPAQPTAVTLQDGYRTGKVGIEVEVAEGSAGRRLSLTLHNRTEAELTVSMRAGNVELEAGSPINTLRFSSSGAIRHRLPPDGRTSPMIVEQRGNRGINEGRCDLSVYQGKHLFSGSVTIGPLPK